VAKAAGVQFLLCLRQVALNRGRLHGNRVQGLRLYGLFLSDEFIDIGPCNQVCDFRSPFRIGVREYDTDDPGSALLTGFQTAFQRSY
jgi:hypothetical protein